MQGLRLFGQEEVVILEVEYAHAVSVVELLHLRHYIVDASYPELHSTHAIIPGIDAAKGAVSPAAPAGENAGDGFAKVRVEGGALGKRQRIQIILFAMVGFVTTDPSDFL